MMFKLLQILTRLKLLFAAKFVGEDEYHNRYYELKAKDCLDRKKRFCIYSGVVEATKIPAHWHAWMHYTTNDPLEYKNLFWMKSHMPDVTGTLHAFQPNKHTQFNVHGKLHINKIQSYTPWDGTISPED